MLDGSYSIWINLEESCFITMIDGSLDFQSLFLFKLDLHIHSNSFCPSHTEFRISLKLLTECILFQWTFISV